MNRSFLYLDHCATTPLDESVRASMIAFLNRGNFGNPAALHHAAGAHASDAVEAARLVMAEEFGVAPQQVIFTSGASEANNLVILGFWLRFRDRGCRILYGATEHKSVLDAAKQLGELPGCKAIEVNVGPDGVVSIEHLENLLTDNPQNLPTLVALMHSNNEIPACHPVEEIAQLCLKHRAYFHCDAVQGFVREPIDFRKTSFGSAVISTHKIYGPKGLGLLVLGSSATCPVFVPPYVGGEQEFGLRPGTLNTLAIVGGAAAIKKHRATRAALVEHMKVCDEVFIQEMSRSIPSFRLTVPRTDQVPGIVNFYIEGYDSPTLLDRLTNVCISRGAACTGAGGQKYSHVPRALGLPIEIEANVLRASFGWAVTVDELRKAVTVIAGALS